MIWDYIRDFLVQYIFGGVDSLGNEFLTSIGGISLYEKGTFVDYLNVETGNIVEYEIGSNGVGNTYSIALADWLASTTTIIIMCLAVFLMIMLVRWVWRLVTSAFLLK